MLKKLIDNNNKDIIELYNKEMLSDHIYSNKWNKKTEKNNNKSNSNVTMVKWWIDIKMLKNKSIIWRNKENYKNKEDTIKI